MVIVAEHDRFVAGYDDNKDELIKIFSVPIGEADAIRLSQIIFQYLWNDKWKRYGI